VSLLDQAFLSDKKDRGVYLFDKSVVLFGDGLGRGKGLHKRLHDLVGVIVPSNARKVLGPGVAEDGKLFGCDINNRVVNERYCIVVQSSVLSRCIAQLCVLLHVFIVL
jgi:hypothetical protein